MRNKILDYIINEVLNGESEITDDTSLYEGGLISSMGHLKLVQFLEHRFDVSLPMGEIDMENFDTVDQIADFVSSQMS
jgi:methoxymalonate biosynthesis acyl carrier protein